MTTWNNAPRVPFGEKADRVLLDPDPLVRVITQVRFSPVPSTCDQAFIKPFREAIRDAYPVIQKEAQQTVGQGADGRLQVSDSVVWQFRNAESGRLVALSDNFVALSFDEYETLDDFVTCLTDVLNAIKEHIRPDNVARVGFRYVHRLSGPETLDRLPEFVRPELLGIAAADLGYGSMSGNIMAAEFRTDEVRLMGRWGHVPIGMSPDLSIAALDEPSWILDLDAYAENELPFDPAPCAANAKHYADIAYSFFRWAVSDGFLAAHGA